MRSSNLLTPKFVIYLTRPTDGEIKSNWVAPALPSRTESRVYQCMDSYRYWWIESYFT